LRLVLQELQGWNRARLRVLSNKMEITDANQDEILAGIVGRRIISIVRDRDSDLDWPSGENKVSIVMEDGSRLRFVGWGYDASGIISYFIPAGAADD
jgi:hypothetical protein